MKSKHLLLYYRNPSAVDWMLLWREFSGIPALFAPEDFCCVGELLGMSGLAHITSHNITGL